MSKIKQILIVKLSFITSRSKRYWKKTSITSENWEKNIDHFWSYSREFFFLDWCNDSNVNIGDNDDDNNNVNNSDINVTTIINIAIISLLIVMVIIEIDKNINDKKK